MSPKLDKQLCEKYPEIFRNRDANIQQSAMAFGMEHNDGWYHLIDALCSAITHHLKYNAKPGTPPVIADQIKEKFGTLRFYYHGGDDTIDAFVQFAEFFSGRICETCGNPGKVRGGTWLYTACDAHTEPQDLDNKELP